MSHPNTDQLLDDLKQVIHDAEELLKATAGQAGEHISQARVRAEASLRSAKAQLAEMGGGTAGNIRNAAKHANTYVKSNPWIAVGAGALFAGFTIIAAFWDTHRVLIAVAVAAGFFALAGVALAILLHKWRQRPHVLDWILHMFSILPAHRQRRSL